MMSRMLSAPEPHVVGHDVHVGVQRGQRLLGRVDLAVADAVHVVQDLALQVRLVDHVHVDDAERADAGRGQVEGGRRAQPAGAEQEDLRVEQLQLAHLAHLGQEQVALVAVALGRGQGLRRRPGAAVVLPLVEPADHATARRCSRGRPWSWRRRPSARRRRSRRRSGAALSGSLPSTWNSRWPRGRWTASGMAPCSYSSGSRTSRKVTPPPSSRALRVGLVHLADGRLGLVQQISGSGHARTSGSRRPARTAGIER